MKQNFFFDAFIVYGWGVETQSTTTMEEELGGLDVFAYEITSDGGGGTKTIVFGKTCQMDVKSGKITLPDEDKACVDLAFTKYKDKYNNITMTLGFHTALYGKLNGKVVPCDIQTN